MSESDSSSTSMVWESSLCANKGCGETCRKKINSRCNVPCTFEGIDFRAKFRHQICPKHCSNHECIEGSLIQFVNSLKSYKTLERTIHHIFEDEDDDNEDMAVGTLRNILVNSRKLMKDNQDGKQINVPNHVENELTTIFSFIKNEINGEPATIDQISTAIEFFQTFYDSEDQIFKLWNSDAETGQMNFLAFVNFSDFKQKVIEYAKVLLKYIVENIEDIIIRSME